MQTMEGFNIQDAAPRTAQLTLAVATGMAKSSYGRGVATGNHACCSTAPHGAAVLDQ